MRFKNLLPVDLIHLSQESRKHNLDDLGRELSNGRRVNPTVNGARSFAPRKGVQESSLWETATNQGGGSPPYEITSTTVFLGGQCIGFIVTTECFDLQVAQSITLYFSDHSICLQELTEIKGRFLWGWAGGGWV